jgi:hypothetical protein
MDTYITRGYVCIFILKLGRYLNLNLNLNAYYALFYVFYYDYALNDDSSL